MPLAKKIHQLHSYSRNLGSHPFPQNLLCEVYSEVRKIKYLSSQSFLAYQQSQYHRNNLPFPKKQEKLAFISDPSLRCYCLCPAVLLSCCPMYILQGVVTHYVPRTLAISLLISVLRQRTSQESSQHVQEHSL